MNALSKILCLFCLLPVWMPAVEENAADILTVIGEGKTTVQATVAEVRLAIEVEERTAHEVQEALARKSQPVVDLLRSEDVTKLEAGNINTYPQYSNSTPAVIVGYRGSNIIKFEAPVEKAGILVDAAIKVGANSVQSISVHPEESILAQARSEALRAAIDSALRDANTVLSALKLKFIGIVKVEVAPQNHFGPVYARNYKAMAMASAAPSTEVTEQEQEISASVTLQIQYGS